MPRKRVWIVDGHNVIFAIHDLKELQIRGRGEEARDALAERLEVFALQRQERVLVVFDGNVLAVGTGADRGAHFEVVYARGGEGAADRHILLEATRCSGQGLPITVVTDDVRTLGKRLPQGVVRLGVRRFWLAHVEPRPTEDEKPVAGEISDLERAMLAQATASERVTPTSRTTAPTRRAPAPSPAREAGRERLQSKREKGRLRQERRLKRRAGR